MNTKPVLTRPLGATIVAAALSFPIAIGLFAAVADLFLREGTPLHNVAMTERACSDVAFVSERRHACDCFLPQPTIDASRAAELEQR
jgi:hypothetical protein